MKAETVSFEELDREHRHERARDAQRLRSGAITPIALQEENSFLPMDTKVSFDLVRHLDRPLRSK